MQMMQLIQLEELKDLIISFWKSKPFLKSIIHF
jgi:hypothetical protein